MATVKGTWKFNNTLVEAPQQILSELITFSCAGENYDYIFIVPQEFVTLIYGQQVGEIIEQKATYTDGWKDEVYRTIVFTSEQEVSDEFYKFLITNAREVGTKKLALIDSAKFEADLKSVADIIREKNGTTELLEYPQGFISGIGELGVEEDYIAKVYNKEITELVNDKIITTTNNFQSGNKGLTKVDLPNATSLAESSFSGCSALVDLSLPSVTNIYASSLNNTGLTNIYMPSLEKTSSWGYGFANCAKLEKIYLPVLTNLVTRTFEKCTKLKAVVLGSGTICSLADTIVFNGSSVVNGNGYIYVPKVLADGSDGVTSYQNATNWTTHASKIRAIEDYPEIVEWINSLEGVE